MSTLQRAKGAATTSCDACPLRKLPAFREFTNEEFAFIKTFKMGEHIVQAGETILHEGSSSPHLYTVLSGWAFRYKSLPDGRRQILNFALPGDLLGLQAAVFMELDHSIEALSTMSLCVFSRSKTWDVFKDHAGLAFDLTWIASREERLLDEQLLTVGRRSAIERIAYLLVQIHNRAANLNMMPRGMPLRMPLTQQHVADALGLSLVHTNKTLRRLTKANLVDWQDGMCRILDEDRLRGIAGFETREIRGRPFL